MKGCEIMENEKNPHSAPETEAEMSEGKASENKATEDKAFDGEATEDKAFEADAGEYIYTPQKSIPQKPKLFLSPGFCVPIFMIFVCVLILLTDGVRFGSGDGVDMYLSFVAVQLIVFMLPCVFYVRYRFLDIRESVRVRLPSPDKIMFTVLCALVLILTSMTMSAVGGVFGGVYKGNANGISAPADTRTAIYYAVCFAVVPAICEELMFRGIIMSEYQRTSVAAAVITSSLFFAMIHFDLKLLPFYFLSGLVLSMCAYASNSIIASFFAHMLYNLFAIFGGGIVDRVMRSVGSVELLAMALGALLLFILILTFGECRRIYYLYAKRNKDSSYAPKHKQGTAAVRFASVLLSPGAIAVTVIFAVAAILKNKT